MIGILGGTFDPIHNGHLHIAKQVLADLALDQLQFMPCAIPVHRDQPQSSARHRRKMIELVISGQQGFVLNPIELDRSGPSYTIDSLREIHRQTDAKLVLLLGTDAFNGFAGWKQPEEILTLAHLLVCQRPGNAINTALFEDHWINSTQQLDEAQAGTILRLKIEECDCSSSEVRQLLLAGKIPDRCLDPAVVEYIKAQNLYRGISG